ncbi:MAG: hypothetical protein BIFFINMI_00822 [Phycisphaerae bacterium]|nr:hypothetical protein [Phycisphaerae bacterium]
MDGQTPFASATFTPSLADINLKFYNASGYVQGSLIDQSVSTVDNVEHIYLTGLSAGRYEFTLGFANSDFASWDYAVTWDAQLAAVAVPEPATLALLLLGALAAPLARRRRK